MNKNKRVRRSLPTLLISLLSLLTLSILCSDRAFGQWATNGNNINNTNTGNVGIGTTNPNGKLDVYGGRIVIQPSASGGFMLINDPTWGNAGLFETTASGDIHLKAYSSGFASPQLFLKNGGNIGIGTTTAPFPLTVRNDSYSISGLGNWRIISQFDNAAGSMGVNLGYDSVNGNGILGSPGTAGLAIWGDNGSTFAERLRVTGAGNVGIGTTSPGVLLDLKGNSTAYGGQLRLSSTDFNQISFYNSNNLTLNGTNRLGAIQYDVANSNLYFQNFSGNKYIILNDSGGNVGIGTTSPRGALDVAGGESFATIGMSGSYGSGAVLSGSSGSTFLSNNVYLNSAANQFKVVDSTKTSAGLQLVSRDIYFRSFSAATTPVHTELLFINGTSGNIGISTISPAYRLDVQGGAVNASGGLCIAGDCKTAWSQVGGNSQWTTSGSSIYYNSGNVGIGTAAPESVVKLQVVGPVLTTGSIGGYSFRNRESSTNADDWVWYSTSNVARLWRANVGDLLGVTTSGSLGLGTTNPVGKLDVRQIGNSGLLATVLTSYGVNEDTFIRGGSSSAVVHIGDVTSTTSKLLLMENGGNVGIGTTSPTAKLDVNGNAKVTGDIEVTGNINAKYQDVAEWVPATHALSAGTVVILNPAKSNEVMASAEAYDTRVAGVVSARPGITLGEAGEDKVLVATTGRVKVKVDATRSPVRVGDLLVTSDREGVAMKSEPVEVGGVKLHRPGTLVGKALEPLEKGVGEILVLLSLQ